MKEKKYLPLYYKWMETGIVDGENGLCRHFIHDEFFELIKPDNLEQDIYCAWWASLVTEDIYWTLNSEEKRKVCSDFNPLRQNIVLLMAAMNGEL